MTDQPAAPGWARLFGYDTNAVQLAEPVSLDVVRGVVDLTEVVFNPAWNGDHEQPGGLVPGPEPVRAADTYTPCPAPIAACESKTTMPTSGRTAMLRECVTSGEETQKTR